MQVKRVVPALVGLVAAGWLSSALAEPEKIAEAEQREPIAVADGTQGKPVFLKTMKARYETPNAVIGALQKGWLCSPSGNITWSDKLFNAFSGRLPKVFRAELEKAHYPVPKVSDAIFEEAQDKTKSGPELQVGMLVKEVKANLCLNGENTQGGVYLKIFWQAYAPEAQKVVFEATTEGSYQPEGPQKLQYTLFFANAFAAAARNLLAEQGFYDAVTAPAGAVAKTTTGLESLKLKLAKAPTEPLAKHITTLRSAVATIVSDNNTGTGFFVSQDGHMLTNAHVVGSARFVKVKLPTGRELVGETLRSDKTRDVALVKTEPIAVQPISLSSGEPNIGEEVYALGSPLGDKFNTSLTRGVLSGYRTLQEQRYLQSDVVILPGNSGGPLLDAKGAAVGITVMGMGAKGMAGMNFFIPIADALARLGIEGN